MRSQRVQSGAILGGGILGGALGAGSSLWFNWQTCKAPREMAQEAALEWAYGAALGMAGGGLAAKWAAGGAKPLANLLGTTAVGAGAQLVVDEVRDRTSLP